MVQKKVEFKGTPDDFDRLIEAMKSEGLDVQVHTIIPIELEGSEF
ncbi:hypothetical protein [Phormidium pseudopriestleyi]|nr:hypothetical protein [Phormidium pseudopriestleyi]